MKRILAFVLVLIMLLPLVACGETKEPQTTDAAVETAEKPKKTEEKKEDKSPVVLPTVENPLSRDDLEAIPIANSSMSSDELRQICLDFIELSVSFPWTIKEDLPYHVISQDYDVEYNAGGLYAGIPYVNVASGNVYRWLDVVDPETGVWNAVQFDLDNILWGTACSGTACWAFSRVVNSAKMGWTANMTQKNGFIPVGPYTYANDFDRYGENGAPDCSDIAKQNGEQVMYESYAKLLPADCLVNNGHVRLNAGVPSVVRKEDGTIDGKRSTTLWSDQGMYRNQPYQMRKQADGTEYSIQGGVEVPITFEELFKGGYLPHTFAEFLGTDPVEDAQVSLGQSGTITGSQIKNLTAEANYTISDVYFTFKGEDGKTVQEYAIRARNPFARSLSLKTFPDGAFLKYADGKHTLEISAQVSNGARPVVYSGIYEK